MAINENKLKALELAIGYVGKDLALLTPTGEKMKRAPDVRVVAKVIVGVARTFEDYLGEGNTMMLEKKGIKDG